MEEPHLLSSLVSSAHAALSSALSQPLIATVADGGVSPLARARLILRYLPHPNSSLTPTPHTSLPMHCVPLTLGPAPLTSLHFASTLPSLSSHLDPSAPPQRFLSALAVVNVVNASGLLAAMEGIVAAAVAAATGTYPLINTLSLVLSIFALAHNECIVSIELPT